ncbi:hypothetical protein MBANPS3_007551 [Mucor bainieri]
MLSDGCGSLANLDSIKSMTYAILLTLCELSTASIPIPHECREIQQQQDPTTAISHDVITKCALYVTTEM